ncbi:MAG: hypothetical protein GY715_09585 [Planctomycetes bacterium]|nr:hypothetical protein [Planctomycetota bacterium]
MRTALLVLALGCFAWWIVNPLRWWFPRHGGKRSPGTTTGWVAPTEAFPPGFGELRSADAPPACRRYFG